jgi:hypothetical protein
MKTLIYLLPLLVVLSCGKKDSRTVHNPEQVQHLLSLYKNISFDTLKVASESNPDAGTYKGTPMDSAAVALLPKPYSTSQEPNQVYACFSFKIDTHTTGLITRVPSEYVSSSVVLFLFDERKQVCLPGHIELAETLADAGDALVKTSWLMKEKEKTSAFIHIEENHDHSVDDPNDTLQESWDYYYLVNIEQQKADTISKDNAYLKTKFGHLFLPRKF